MLQFKCVLIYHQIVHSNCVDGSTKHYSLFLCVRLCNLHDTFLFIRRFLFLVSNTCTHIQSHTAYLCAIVSLEFLLVLGDRSICSICPLSIHMFDCLYVHSYTWFDFRRNLSFTTCKDRLIHCNRNNGFDFHLQLRG